MRPTARIACRTKAMRWRKGVDVKRGEEKVTCSTAEPVASLTEHQKICPRPSPTRSTTRSHTQQPTVRPQEQRAGFQTRTQCSTSSRLSRAWADPSGPSSTANECCVWRSVTPSVGDKTHGTLLAAWAHAHWAHWPLYTVLHTYCAVLCVVGCLVRDPHAALHIVEARWQTCWAIATLDAHTRNTHRL